MDINLSNSNEFAEYIQSISEVEEVNDRGALFSIKSEYGSGTASFINNSGYIFLAMVHICLNHDVCIKYQRRPTYFEMAYCLHGTVYFDCPCKNVRALHKDDILVCKGDISKENTSGVMRFPKGENLHLVSCSFDREIYCQYHKAIGCELWGRFLWADDVKKGRVLITDSMPHIKLLLLQIFETDIPNDSLRNLFVKSKVIEVLTQIAASDYGNKKDIKLSIEEKNKIKRVPELMMFNSSEPYTINLLAEELGMKVFRLKKGFKLLYGDTIYSYYKKLKLQQAAHLLQTTNKTVLNVALDVGYQSQSQFGVSFKKFYGLTPFEYSRKKIPL